MQKFNLTTRKADSGIALRELVMELGVPEKLNGRIVGGTKFMKQCCRNDTSVYRKEPERPRQNPAEEVILGSNA